MEQNYIIYVYPSYYLIPSVYEVPSMLRKSLSKWDTATYKTIDIGFVFNNETHELRVPRGYPEDTLRMIFPERRFEEVKVDTYDEVSIQLCGKPRDYIQTSMLAFMLGEDPYCENRSKPQLFSDLDTGLGKTVIGIICACYYKSRAVVITPALTKIMDQWYDSIIKFTTLNRDEILLVQGGKMCCDIIAGKYKNVKFFIVPRSTILSFVRKFDNNYSIITDLFDAMKVNMKIVDEAHMDFSTNVIIDCYTNIAKTYYMSSSPTRSELAEKKIYYRVFKNVPRYGKKILTAEQKHIIPLILQFESTPTKEQLKHIRTVAHGPSLAKYGDYLLDPEGARDEFLDAYAYSLYLLQRYRRNGGKILVLCITIRFAEELKKYTNEVFPYLTTGLFIGSEKDKSKELDNDVIFSTIKSMGTGSEIENHQLTINTITYASDVLADQIPGRIRKQHDRLGIYCEIVNMAHPVARKHYETREPYLRRKAKDGKIMIQTVDSGSIAAMDKFISSGYTYNKNGFVIKESKILMHRKKTK